MTRSNDEETQPIVDSHLLASRSVGPFTCTLCGRRRVGVGLGYDEDDPTKLYIIVYCADCNNRMLVKLEETDGSYVPGRNSIDAGVSTD